MQNVPFMKVLESKCYLHEPFYHLVLREQHLHSPREREGVLYTYIQYVYTQYTRRGAPTG